MSLYYVIVTLVCLLGLISIDKHINRHQTLYMFFVIFIILSIFAGTRLIGHDYETYAFHYNTLKPIDEYYRSDLSMELGYEYIASIIKYFSQNFNIFLLIYTFLSLLISFYTFWKYSPYPIISIMLFCAFWYFIMVMGQMRQPFAVALSYYFAIPLLLRKKRLIASLIILWFGILFHKSLFFFSLFIGLSVLNISYKKYIMLFCLAIFILVTSSLFLNNLLIAVLPKDFYLYSTAVSYLTYKSESMMFSLGMLERIGCCVVIFYFTNKNQINNSLLKICSNIYALGSIFYISLLGVSTEFAARGSHPFTFSLFIALPILIKELRGKQRSIVISVAFLLSLYHFTDFLTNPSLYNPYKSILW